MKKTMILIFLLLAFALGERAAAQELIGSAGAGYFWSVKTPDPTIGNYEFVEAKLMFGHKIRYGPLANYTWVYAKQSKETPYYYKGRFYTLGLSFDTWGSVLHRNYYAWANPGIRWDYDRGATLGYHSWQKDKLFILQTGLRLTNLGSDWLGNSLFMAEWQKPLAKGKNRFSTDPEIIKEGIPYEKGAFRLVYENGVKKFSFSIKERQIRFEPILHLGYGWEKTYDRKYYEYGGGFAFSYFKEWQRELFKIKVYRRQDFGGYNPQNLDGSQAPSWHVEIVANLLRLKLKK